MELLEGAESQTMEGPYRPLQMAIETRTSQIQPESPKGDAIDGRKGMWGVGVA